MVVEPTQHSTSDQVDHGAVVVLHDVKVLREGELVSCVDCQAHAHESEVASFRSFREAGDVENVLEVHLHVFSLSIMDKEGDASGYFDLAVNPTYYAELVVHRY